MKKYTIIFHAEGIGHTAATIESDKGLLHVIFKFTIDHVNLKESDIKSIEVEDVDTLVDFLDNNPPEDTEETPEPTQKEKEIAWLADFEACQRIEHEQNSFHL